MNANIRTSDTDKTHTKFKEDKYKEDFEEDEDQGREYLYNEKTAGVYQEFEVVKISR